MRSAASGLGIGRRGGCPAGGIGRERPHGDPRVGAEPLRLQGDRLAREPRARGVAQHRADRRGREHRAAPREGDRCGRRTPHGDRRDHPKLLAVCLRQR